MRRRAFLGGRVWCRWHGPLAATRNSRAQSSVLLSSAAIRAIAALHEHSGSKFSRALIPPNFGVGADEGQNSRSKLRPEANTSGPKPGEGNRSEQTRMVIPLIGPGALIFKKLESVFRS